MDRPQHSKGIWVMKGASTCGLHENTSSIFNFGHRPERKRCSEQSPPHSETGRYLVRWLGMDWSVVAIVAILGIASLEVLMHEHSPK